MRSLSQLKVCFLAGTLGQGGAERQLYYILRALHEAGTALRVLCLAQNEFWESRIKDIGVPVMHIGQGKPRLGRLLRIITELRRDRPHLIQSQHFFLNGYAAAAARVLGVTSVGALRSNGLMEMQDCGRIGGWINLHTPEVLAANSQAAIKYAMEQRISPARLFFLANVVDAAGFKPAAGVRSGPVRLISVGRLIPSKRFDRFISLVAQLRLRLNCEINGLIVGDGPLKGELQEQVISLGLPPAAIEFRGSVADMAPVYREADVFVMTSEKEGTPNVLLEAMASGLPVVSTNAGGVREIIHPGQNGFMVDRDGDEDLCVVLERLIQDCDLRAAMGQRGRAYVEARHSLEWLPVMLSGLYELALADPQNRSARPAVLSPLIEP